MKYTFTGPSSPTAVAITGLLQTTATTFSSPAASLAFGTAIANAGTATTTTNFTDAVSLSLENGANAGTVQLQAAQDTTGTATVLAGSYCVVQ
jgi:hypothetical protein